MRFHHHNQSVENALSIALYTCGVRRGKKEHLFPVTIITDSTEDLEEAVMMWKGGNEEPLR